MIIDKKEEFIMGVASRVMYTIANFFTWLVVIACIAGLVVFPLMMTGVIQNTSGYPTSELLGVCFYLGIVLFFSLVSIGMVRIAKAKGTSKGWDILFIIIGVLCSNIFYVLGGIFGLFSFR